MTFFDDVLRGANGRMGVDAWDPFKSESEVKSWTATFKAAPRKSVAMEFTRIWQQGWKDGEPDDKVATEKTNTKLKIVHGDCTTSWGFASDKFSMNGTGVLYKADGYTSNLTGTLESKPAKGEWKVSGEANLKTPDVGGAKFGVNAGFDHKLDGSATTVKPKVNITLQDEINVGVGAEHDTKDLKKGLFQCVYAPAGSGKYWLRADMMNKLFSAGCDNSLNDTTRHSFEGVYMMEEKAEGIQGQPVMVRGGVEYDLSDATSLEAAGKWGKDVEFEQTVTHQCDKNWTVSATQSFDSGLLGTKQGSYSIGFGVTYKL